VRSKLPRYYLRWWGRCIKYLHIMAKREKMCSRARYLVCENAALILNEAMNRYLDELPDLYKRNFPKKKKDKVQYVIVCILV
jgi:hypothetical protein